LFSTEAGGKAFLPASVQGEIARSAESLLGVKIVDVQLRTVGLPLQNEQSIYERMRAERSRTANRYRSEGEEQAIGIRAKADRQASELLAEAEQKAATIEAKADEEATRLYAETYAVDPGFYRFIRSLEASETVLREGGVLVLQSDAPPFDILLEGGR
jgi:membrane protease subunit HflC